MQNKFIISSLSLIGLVSLSSTAYAQANGWYAGAGLGAAQVSSTIDFYGVTDTETSSVGPTVSLNGGYQFDKYFAVEANTSRYHISGQSFGSASLLAKGMLPFTKDWAAFLKAGGAYLYQMGQGSSSANFKGGLGVQYTFAPQWTTGIEYDYTGMDTGLVDSDVQSLSLNVDYSF